MQPLCAGLANKCSRSARAFWVADYETRSYVGWHRHMLLVMVAHLFALEVRWRLQKKTTKPETIPPS